MNRDAVQRSCEMAAELGAGAEYRPRRADRRRQPVRHARGASSPLPSTSRLPRRKRASMPRTPARSPTPLFLAMPDEVFAARVRRPSGSSHDGAPPGHPRAALAGCRDAPGPGPSRTGRRWLGRRPRSRASTTSARAQARALADSSGAARSVADRRPARCAACRETAAPLATRWRVDRASRAGSGRDPVPRGRADGGRGSRGCGRRWGHAGPTSAARHRGTATRSSGSCCIARGRHRRGQPLRRHQRRHRGSVGLRPDHRRRPELFSQTVMDVVGGRLVLVEQGFEAPDTLVR